jgi:DNA polymerase-3 subunit alpha
MAMRIEGMNKTFGVHAAGVVISKDPLDEIVPLQRNNDGQVITQYYMEDVEALGLLKMDFLGLKNLTMIHRAVELVEQIRVKPLTSTTCPWTIPPPSNCWKRGDWGGLPAGVFGDAPDCAGSQTLGSRGHFLGAGPLSTGTAGCGADSQIH